MPSNSSGIKAPGEKIDEALTPHAVLGIPPDASSGEIRAAYIELAKEFHPDAHPGDPLAERRFLRIQEAYSQLKSRHPLFRVYKVTDARSHRHVLWLALTVIVLAPAAVLLATYGLREAPGPMQVKADTETRSDFSPKAQNTSAGSPIPAPPQSEMPEGSLNRQKMALAEPKPDANIAPQNTPQPIGVTPQAEPAGSGQQGPDGRTGPADPALAPASIAGARDKETSSSPAELPWQAPSTANAAVRVIEPLRVLKAVRGRGGYRKMLKRRCLLSDLIAGVSHEQSQR